ncbi:unnamed protein product [Phytomonas sp. EM1]|nr:unnamed protein product [Phytomonas sp. EM1]|eukprot:CCW65899.1 unnamed protein product [Phytomonas sp. isolate EM1]
MAVLLSAVSGTSTAGKTALHVRSTIHVLFVGDPATGKSQLLRFAASVAPRSTSTTGMGSTTAGLTVAATKEMGEFVLEPGALVLSDGGVCVIDELRTVSPADRASLHEAMEQQTISVAKAGLVTRLRTACSVLSACNPPPNRRGSRATEIGVGGPLLSRFDFIFLLWDHHQREVDERIAEHVLSCSVAYRHPDPPLAAEELAGYLWWVRGQYAHVNGPLLSDAAADLLARYYDIQRRRGATPSLEDAVPVTIRFLESLVRITQAHAKLHMQTTCSIHDASMAVFLMERTAYSLKVPLRALGENLYSSSLELDEVFLRGDPESLERQEAVLAALTSVVLQYHTYSPSPESSSFTHPTGVENASKDFLGALTTHLEAEDDGEKEGSLLTQRRAAQLRSMGRPAESDSSHIATQESIRQLSREVSMPFTTPCSRTCYPSDSTHARTTFSLSLKKPLFSTEEDADLRPASPKETHHFATPAKLSEGALNEGAGVKTRGGSSRDPAREQPFARAEPPQGDASSRDTAGDLALPTASVDRLNGSQVDQEGNPPRTNMKRRRTAEDIMRSLRFKF